MPNLTPKQSRFVEEYLVDLNATKAAIRAGFGERSARAVASALLGKPAVAEAVREGMERLTKDSSTTAARVLEEVDFVAFSDIAGAFDDRGRLLPLREMPEGLRRAIASVEVVEEFEGSGSERRMIGWTKKLRFWDKPRALEMRAKYFGLLKERVELTGKDGGPVEVADLTPDEARKLLLGALGKSEL